jgi:ribosomal protein S18 acetylase RimI-like enzyme
MQAPTVPRSLALATDLDVLAPDRLIERRDGFLLVRSPGNPTFYWGNFLLFDREPGAGDGPRWEALFDEAFGDDPRVKHRTFVWDRADGVPGAAREEFGERGYDVVETVGLVADRLEPHPRESREVVVRALDPAVGADEELWSAVVEVQVAGREPGHAEETHRVFSHARLEDRRSLFRLGRRGAWYVALDPETGAVAGSCGVVVTGGRGRFQVVDTAADYRRRGVCSRLVVEAARRACEDHGAEQFVIVAEAGYHALGLYESLGFERRERLFGVCDWPRAATDSATP